jgi:ABC-type Zn uptake system ZnuABC Zn-binding protein ZnuA
VPRWIPLFVIVLGVAACSSCKPKTESRPKVAVSIFPVYDLVRRIAGPDADVVLLLPPGKSEHTFDPTPREVEAAALSKLGVMVGLGLDPWMEKLMTSAAPSASMLKVGERVPTRVVEADPIADEEAHSALFGSQASPGGGAAEDDHSHDKGATDPHVWLDPQRASKMASAIGDEMAKIDPAHEKGYRERTTALTASLDALDKEVDAKASAWKTRGFVTFHGSFGYFAERYHLTIVAVIEPFPGSTPTGKYIESVLGVVKQKNVRAIFSEPQLDPRPARIIADEAKIPLGILDPVGGGPDTDSYEKLIRFDVAALAKVLE